MHWAKRTFPVLVTCALVVAVAFAGLRAWQPLRVTGESMVPALRSGDVVLVERKAAAQIGDIVLIRRPGQPAVLHRVIGCGADGSLVTKGDANPTRDIRSVAPKYAAGRVAAVVPTGALVARLR